MAQRGTRRTVRPLRHKQTTRSVIAHKGGRWTLNSVKAAKAFSGIKIARATRAMTGGRATPIARAVRAFYLG